MGKKFLTLSSKTNKYRLYSQDIKTVYQKRIKTLPPIPRFSPEPPLPLPDSAHFCASFKEVATATPLQ
jgi:hypothetical protein